MADGRRAWRRARLGIALLVIGVPAVAVGMRVTAEAPVASAGDVARLSAPAAGLLLSGADSGPEPGEVQLDTGTIVGRSAQNDVSPPLRSIRPIPPRPWDYVTEMVEPPGVEESEGGEARPGAKQLVDAARQASAPTGIAAIVAGANFAGVGNRNGVYPPDPTGEIGPNHYVQMVNLSFRIFDRAGNSLYGPAANNTLWSGFGGPCQNQNSGDPIVLYDQLANRWLLSQFTSSAPYGECVAISTTGNPTGSYFRYFFKHSSNVFYDYPHTGVWPDGYYTTFNRFKCGALGCSYQGAAVVAYDRAKMLAGQPATFQKKTLQPAQGTVQPADLDGSTPPPAGSPELVVGLSGTNRLTFRRLHVDWATPANTTLSAVQNVNVAAWNQLCPSTSNCVRQPAVAAGLDGLGDRLMYRAAYRNFGSHQAVVLNHSVNAAAVGTTAGVRWYEVRNPLGTPTLFQQGTFAPDATNRWMASAAQDKQGNIGLAYTASSASVFPSIRYAGRLTSDPLGTLGQGEATLIAGAGSQTGPASRWGDYSHLSLDPLDDCTFWFTHEYLPSTGTAPWATRIGSFRFSTCT